MMTYTYPRKPITGDKLEAELRAAGLSVVGVSVSGSEIRVTCSTYLDVSQHQLLGSIVSAHQPADPCRSVAELASEIEAEMHDLPKLRKALSWLLAERMRREEIEIPGVTLPKVRKVKD